MYIHWHLVHLVTSLSFLSKFWAHIKDCSRIDHRFLLDLELISHVYQVMSQEKNGPSKLCSLLEIDSQSRWFPQCLKSQGHHLSPSLDNSPMSHHLVPLWQWCCPYWQDPQHVDVMARLEGVDHLASVLLQGMPLVLTWRFQSQLQDPYSCKKNNFHRGIHRSNKSVAWWGPSVAEEKRALSAIF